MRAPFAGVVTGRHLDPGDWTMTGSAAVDLVSAQAVEVQVDATWELASRLHPGDAVAILASDRSSSAEGQVVAVVPALDPVTRTSRFCAASTLIITCSSGFRLSGLCPPAGWERLETNSLLPR